MKNENNKSKVNNAPLDSELPKSRASQFSSVNRSEVTEKACRIPEAEPPKSRASQFSSVNRSEVTEKARRIPEAELPTSKEIENELDRAGYKSRYSKVLRSTVYTLITVAAVAVLVATIFLPVFQVYGMSMTPTLEEGEIIVSVKGSKLKQGDIVAFYFNNKILVKRVIATAGDKVNIDEDGNVSVNDILLDEPYLTEKALGECDIDLPYQVPDGRIFVMGDHRSVSVDSRSTSCGPVADEQIAGKIVFVVWPLDKFGPIIQTQ